MDEGELSKEVLYLRGMARGKRGMWEMKLKKGGGSELLDLFRFSSASLHSGNLLLEKGFLLYFLCKCFSFTKQLNKEAFFALTEVPSSIVKVKKSPQTDFLLWPKQPFVCIFVFKQ